MKRGSLALPHMLPLRALDLGSAVANQEHPTQSKYTSSDLEISEEAGNILVTQGSNYEDLQRYDRGAGLSVLLSHIFKTELAGDVHRDLSIGTKMVKTYLLVNSDDVFAELCEDVAFQLWL